MKYAFLVDTPVQLLNVINYVLSNDIGKCSDVYIVDQFYNAEAIYKALVNERLFSNVYLLKREKKGIFKHIWTIMGLLVPNIYYILLYKHNVKREQYDCVFLSCPTKLFDFFISASKASIVNGYEDGIGSYYGDAFRDLLSRKYIFARQLFNHQYNISALYLNVPEVYAGTISACIKKLGNGIEDEQNAELVKRIFGANNVMYGKKMCYYFNQPVDANNARVHLLNESKILESIKNSMLGKEMVIRLHPREKEIDRYEGFAIEKPSCLWEIVCNSVIDETSILIGEFSTAQFVPKLLYSMEPTIIFTYYLYDDYDVQKGKDYETMVSLLRKSYNDKSKIYNVKTMEELKQILNAHYVKMDYYTK